MKIRVLLNNLKTNVLADFAKAKDYFIRHGLPIEWTFEETDITGYHVETEKFAAGTRLEITGHESRITLSRDFITIFAFNGDEFPLPNIPSSKCQILPGGVLITYMTYPEGGAFENYLTLIHELMHGINKQLSLQGINLPDPMDMLWQNNQWLYYYHNDQPEALNSNFGEAWKILTPYLSKLTTQPMYKFFKDSEIVGLKPELVGLLDQARGFAGVPFLITSGYRTPDQNTAVGGVEGSTHTLGLGVDILADTDLKRLKIVSGAIKAGFNRIGIYQKHIHLDSGQQPNFPQDVMWIINKD